MKNILEKPAKRNNMKPELKFIESKPANKIISFNDLGNKVHNNEVHYKLFPDQKK